jgi:uncharacterized protein
MIHRYKLNGYNLVLDTYSGSVHTVDDLAYDVIGLYETMPADQIVQEMLDKYADAKITRDDIREVIADAEALKKAGKLYAPDLYAGLAPALKQRSQAVKALCLHAAHTCNLNCGYCFAGQGRYKGSSGLMSYEVGKQALDYLIANSGSRVNLEVDFFGGEPLINWDVCKRLVAYARSREAGAGKKFRFTLTTNGLLIDDDVIAFANREMHNVVLSLDGRRETHDRLRKTAGGNGSYDRIVPKFRQFADSRNGKGYYIRGTFTHYNTDFLQDVLHMADLGFDQLSMEPVVCAPEDPYALTEEDLPRVLEQYELLAVEMLRREKEGRGFTFYHFMLDLKGGPCVYKRVSGCGSGTEYMAVTPGGELFPCHQFVGDSACSLGNVWDGVTNTALRDRFRQCNVYARPECADCWARMYCSGGCAANAYHSSGSMEGIHEYGCRIFRKRIECAIMIKAAQAEASARAADPNGIPGASVTEP